MEMYALVFVSAFFNVFLLGANSMLIRDEKIFATWFVSWFITLAQFGSIWAVVHAGLSPVEYIIASGIGGSCGITSSQLFYKRLRKYMEDKQHTWLSRYI